MKCNIAIPAPDALAQKSISLSKQLAEYDSEFILDGINYFPHLTLYMSYFDEAKIPEVILALSKVIEGRKSLALTAEKYFMNVTHYIDIQYLRSSELFSFHNDVIEALAPLRLASTVSPDHYSGPDAEAMYKNLMNFGYAIGKSLYRPHVTLTKLKEDNPEALNSLAWDSFDFRAQEIGIFEADDLGCCRHLIQAFKLND